MLSTVYLRRFSNMFMLSTVYLRRFSNMFMLSTVYLRRFSALDMEIAKCFLNQQHIQLLPGWTSSNKNIKIKKECYKCSFCYFFNLYIYCNWYMEVLLNVLVRFFHIFCLKVNCKKIIVNFKLSSTMPFMKKYRKPKWTKKFHVKTRVFLG